LPFKSLFPLMPRVAVTGAERYSPLPFQSLPSPACLLDEVGDLRSLFLLLPPRFGKLVLTHLSSWCLARYNFIRNSSSSSPNDFLRCLLVHDARLKVPQFFFSF